jgi:hypothetical protein
MAPAMNDLISGQIAVGFVNITAQVVALHRLAPWVGVGLGTLSVNSSIFIGMRWVRERRNVLQSLGSMHQNAGFLGFALENACV